MTEEDDKVAHDCVICTGTLGSNGGTLTLLCGEVALLPIFCCWFGDPCPTQSDVCSCASPGHPFCAECICRWRASSWRCDSRVDHLSQQPESLLCSSVLHSSCNHWPFCKSVRDMQGARHSTCLMQGALLAGAPCAASWTTGDCGQAAQLRPQRQGAAATAAGCER